MWVKICGNTNLEDARHALEAGADALGFVFAASPRRVTADEARRIVEDLPRDAETFGVFVNAGIDEIVSTGRECGLSGVQLHGGEDFVSHLRGELPGVRIAVVLNFVTESATNFAQQIRKAAGEADMVLVDSRTATAAGGTGIRFDWQAAQEGFAAARGEAAVVAAGGLSPENVGEAIRVLNPWGVDVVSGVEASPGRKDPRKVEAFIQAAKAPSLSC